MTLALLLFAATYLLMLRLQQYRPWVALCSAVLFIVLGDLCFRITDKAKRKGTSHETDM